MKAPLSSVERGCLALAWTFMIVAAWLRSPFWLFCVLCGLALFASFAHWFPRHFRDDDATSDEQSASRVQ